MKWIGQNIWDQVSRFRNHVYFEDSITLSTGKSITMDEYTSGTISITKIQDSGTTFNDTGLTIDITPSSTSSKIYVMSHVSMGATNGYRFALRLVRGSTDISVATSAGSRTVATVAHEGTGGNKIDQTFPIFFLDSPATTSATTYKIQAACEQGGGTWYLNRGGLATDNSTVYAATSSIAVMEIAQ